MLHEHALPPGGTGRRGVLCLYALQERRDLP
mgnify:CR=1 FL=1